MRAKILSVYQSPVSNIVRPVTFVKFEREDGIIDDLCEASVKYEGKLEAGREGRVHVFQGDGYLRHELWLS